MGVFASNVWLAVNYPFSPSHLAAAPHLGAAGYKEHCRLPTMQQGSWEQAPHQGFGMPPQQGVQQNGMMPQQYAQQNFAAPTGSIVESTGYGRSGWERKHSICAGGLCFLALAGVVTFIIVTVTDVFKSDDTRTLVQVVSILCCGPLGFFMLFALNHHFRNPGLSP